MIITRPKRKTGGKLALIALIFSCLFLISPVATAQQSSSTIAQGFQTTAGSDEIVSGSMVSFKTNTSQEVELATTESAEYLAGVVDENSLVTISGNAKEVPVVLSGTANVLVSDINGQIKAGDKITASPIAGVGMLATSESQIVGTAQGDFNISKSQTKTIQDRSGKPHSVHIGQIPVQVGVAFYKAPGSNFLPPFLQNAANSIAGRSVSIIRVLLCTVLLLLGFISVAVLIYTSVRSAMTSLGRNPLAARAIQRGLYQTGLVAALIIGGVILASYFILKL